MSFNLYPQIKINSLYLTQGNVNAATRYIAVVRGLDALALSGAIQTIKALNGTPYVQLTENQLGKPISIELPKLLTADFSSIKTIIQAYITSGTAISLDLTGGDYGDFTSLAVVPDENPIRYAGEFQNGKILNVSVHFITT